MSTASESQIVGEGQKEERRAEARIRAAPTLQQGRRRQRAAQFESQTRVCE